MQIADNIQAFHNLFTTERRDCSPVFPYLTYVSIFSFIQPLFHRNHGISPHCLPDMSAENDKEVNTQRVFTSCLLPNGFGRSVLSKADSLVWTYISTCATLSASIRID